VKVVRLQSHIANLKTCLAMRYYFRLALLVVGAMVERWDA
jgi:hypothetical protein